MFALAVVGVNGLRRLKKLHVQLGDLVEIHGRRYDVVPASRGGVALEPEITKSVADIHREHGGRSATQAEFDERAAAERERRRLEHDGLSIAVLQPCAAAR